MDVSIEIIQKCPNSCIHCSSKSSLLCENYITLDHLIQVINGVKQLGATRICLSGGEPFLHKQLKEIVEYLHTMEMHVDIYSSGISYENGEMSFISLELLRELKECGLDGIIYNMQACDDDIYNCIMNTKDNLKHLITSIKNTQIAGISTEIHFVPNKINLFQIDPMIDFILENHIDRISFLRLVNHGRAKENSDKLILSDEEKTYLEGKLHELADKFDFVRVGIPLSQHGSLAKCHAYKEKIYIKFDGLVYGCEAFKYIDLYNDKMEIISPDSIYQKDIVHIYNESQYLKLESEFIHKYSELHNCNGCYENCPVQNYLMNGRIN